MFSTAKEWESVIDEEETDEDAAEGILNEYSK